MTPLPPCPACASVYAYEDGARLACPECGHEWTPGDAAIEEDVAKVVRDANGNALTDGDHDIDCRIEGIGPMKLKSVFVKKD